MRKRGQMQISFGMIFSIIIIIAILVSSFVVIKWVLENQRCMEIKLFIEDLKNEIDKSWKSEDVVFTMTRSLPTTIEYVCFINMPDDSGVNEEIAEQIKQYSPGNNLFLIPAKKACESGSESLENIRFENFCVKNTGRVSLKFLKKFDENFVRISESGSNISEEKIDNKHEACETGILIDECKTDKDMINYEEKEDYLCEGNCKWWGLGAGYYACCPKDLDRVTQRIKDCPAVEIEIPNSIKKRCFIVF